MTAPIPQCDGYECEVGPCADAFAPLPGTLAYDAALLSEALDRAKDAVLEALLDAPILRALVLERLRP